MLEAAEVLLTPVVEEHYHRRTIAQERIVMGRRVIDYCCSVCGVAL
jgi:hypothetical protein